MKAKDIALILVVVVLVAFTPNSPISVLARDVLADARPAPLAAPVGTAFTYQGQLTDGGQPADGVYDFQFTLWDAETSGGQIGPIVTRGDVAVAGGIFTEELDFGAAAFAGEARWLEIGVRPGASVGSYTTLDPRQKVNPTPYALYASNADTLDGQHSTAFATSAHNHWGQTWTGSGDGLTLTSSNGIGLSASSTAGSGLHYGVYGISNSTSGNGVVGWATAGSGSTDGVAGRSDSPTGKGVNGYTTAATGGTGVFGEANATSGGTAGVEGISHATDGGAGVYGVGAASTGWVMGVYGWSQSTGGNGVFGYTTAASGATIGVRGRSDSTSGWGGVFDSNGNGVLARAPASGNIFEGRQSPSDAVKFTVNGAGNVHSTGNLAADGAVTGTTLQATGNVTAGGTFHYTTPRTRVISIPPEAFLPSTNVDYDNHGHGMDYYGAHIVSGAGIMVAPVQLPQDAVVTQFQLWLFDGSDSDLDVSLFRCDNASGWGNLMAEVQPTGWPGYGHRATTTIWGNPIDNTAYNYEIQAFAGPSWDGENLRILAVIIWYTEADAE